MNAEPHNQSPELKSFEVLYAVELGFSIVVKARSEDDAERRVQQRLDETCDVLKGSNRVHFGAFSIQAEEVRP